MEDSKQQFNLEPLYDFFEEWVHPTDFSKILDDLLIDYASLVIKQQMEGAGYENIHEDTTRFHKPTTGDTISMRRKQKV